LVDTLTAISDLTQIKTAQYMRKSTLVLLLFITGALRMVVTVMDATFKQESLADTLGESKLLVKTLGLSDLTIFSEARYTRHLSLADRHSAFQDHPTAFGHFPSGSILLPPAHLRP